MWMVEIRRLLLQEPRDQILILPYGIRLISIRPIRGTK